MKLIGGGFKENMADTVVCDPVYSHLALRN